MSIETVTLPPSLGYGGKLLSRMLLVNSVQHSLTVKLKENTLQLDNRLPHKQTRESLDCSTLVLNTSCPQGCVFTPRLFTLYPHDCASRHQENSIVKYVHHTAITCHIINNTESSSTASTEFHHITNASSRCLKKSDLDIV